MITDLELIVKKIVREYFPDLMEVIRDVARDIENEMCSSPKICVPFENREEIRDEVIVQMLANAIANILTKYPYLIIGDAIENIRRIIFTMREMEND